MLDLGRYVRVGIFVTGRPVAASLFALFRELLPRPPPSPSHTTHHHPPHTVPSSNAALPEKARPAICCLPRSMAGARKRRHRDGDGRSGCKPWVP